MARTPGVVRSLRFRLVAGFALIAAVSALGTGALTFREARTGVLQQSQDTVVNQFRDSVDAAIPGVPAQPGQAELATLVSNLASTHRSQHWRVLATFGGLQASSEPGDDFPELTPALRTSVRTRSVAVFQRVRTDGRSALVVGLPVVRVDDGSPRSGSGLALYLVVPQTTEQRYVSALVGAIERAALPALLLAVLLALFVARGVLRPVRALRDATRRMADGHLDTRLDVHGSDELADLSSAFNETAAALERSVSELRRMEQQARRFAADVSHELRTPLAAMSAVTDVLDEEAAHLEHGTAEAVQLIGEETERLVRLVNDLMEISRFDAGAAELHLDEIDLAESVRRTLAARGWQDQVVAHLPEPGALRMPVDPRRFDVVVANLAGNALRHGAEPVTVTLMWHRDGAGGGPGGRLGGEGGGGSALGGAAVGAGGSAAGGARAWARLVVADGGPGIPAEALPHVFERFYKASSARTRSESSGLGLAITAENVRLHGGRIHVANGPAGGAVFTVDLPAPRGGGNG
ncbi:MAG: HAMP domain-containing histidine kinase [Actinomycetia bacterium]|nr:HAMP domain-containing histidine kinase [Actinomycetes bacterium]